QMAMLLRAGSGIVPAVAAIRRQMRKPTHATLLGQIIADLEDGMPLTDALRRHPRTFHSVYCAIIAAGEASATLTEMFERAAAIVGKQRAMRNKILGALAYPTLLTLMSCNIMLVLLFFVLPRFNDMFVQLGVEAPASTKLMLATADMLLGYWPVVLGAGVLSIVAAVSLLTSQRGRQWISNVQIRIPVFGRIRSRLIQVQVFQTMGTLLQCGVGVLETLDLVRGSTRNRRFQRLFDDLDHAVTSGGQLSTAFEDSGIVEPAICQAVHTGEDSGNLGEAITYCADVLDETNTELINTSMKLIEPAILIGMGLVVGTVAVSLFLPLFDMTSAMR
ncbi:MAG: type II secretion system F family protein, partial [Phycisphaerae bacterium]